MHVSLTKFQVLKWLLWLNRREGLHMLVPHWVPDKHEANSFRERAEREAFVFLAPWVEHGVFGCSEAQQVPHLVAKLGQILAQVVEIFHRGLVCALQLLPCGGQVAVNQTTHDLLVVLVSLLLQVPPLLRPKSSERIQTHGRWNSKSHV